MNNYPNPFENHILAILVVAVGVIAAAFFGFLYGAPMVRRFRTRRAGQEKARHRRR